MVARTHKSGWAPTGRREPPPVQSPTFGFLPLRPPPPFVRGDGGGRHADDRRAAAVGGGGALALTLVVGGTVARRVLLPPPHNPRLTGERPRHRRGALFHEGSGFPQPPHEVRVGGGDRSSAVDDGDELCG